jgi:hypothetical protein
LGDDADGVALEVMAVEVEMGELAGDPRDANERKVPKPI